MVFAFWLLAANDRHAKNLSLHHRRHGCFGVAPLHNVLSAWPSIGGRPETHPLPAREASDGSKADNMHYADVQPRLW
jgi:serine/threonine protein kinase HipA of HipAB toxin-antitoxin module